VEFTSPREVLCALCDAIAGKMLIFHPLN
jgi:hypothetical protein